MQTIHPSMILKVKRDTFIYPESSQGVYLRNNVTSIRIEGSTIEKWLERLVPMLDGTLTLDHITNGLPQAFKDQVFKIVQVLYENGFVRDLSQDLPHQLPEQILTKYASQIEFINHICDSGAHRFQRYREAKVAVMGAGTLLLSLVTSLIQSGLSAFTIIPTHSQKKDHERLKEIVAAASESDSTSKITVLKSESQTWSENLEHYDYIIFGSLDSDLAQLRTVQKICKDQGKHFLPVTINKDLAFAGPLVSPKSTLSWECAHRRVHQSSSIKNESSTSTACALLANVAVFELFKEITGAQDQKKDHSIYRLNLETLEGNWHSVLPHPLVNGNVQAEPIQDPQLFLKREKEQQKDLHSLFYGITSKETGIFYTWEEEELLQLPLSQCKIQVADPRSEGPAPPQPVITCSGLTHEEARLDAGLTGIENYVKSLYGDFSHSMSIGTGQTAADGLCRALQNELHEGFLKSQNTDLEVSAELDIQSLCDNHIQFMNESLTALSPEIKLYYGKKLHGFPVVWIHVNDEWYGSVGLNDTAAIRRALQTAIMSTQNKEKPLHSYGVAVASIKPTSTRSHVSLSDIKEESPQETLSAALHILKKHSIKAQFYSLLTEPVLTDNTYGIFGITLIQEERS
ncbi:bacteriocin maturation protein [Fictibacillus sp. b24]|uniref:bacteriocin maturation protein n=1 Tax=Fictibacillus sp. b24 TaxID=3055863 RepID=UPI0025A1A5B9|nr:bacteriocin maturation protein [Fictibacillus sp. b24]MDM5317174.1 bacteriocin maturation protein [Fictibacillus sp. b24]